MRILVVEDNRKTATFIAKALKSEGFAVDLIYHGDEVLPTIQATSYDAIVLDVMLPGRDGLSIVRHLQAAGNGPPVLLLSARGDVDERVEGLDAGAADYMAKPFALSELIARVRALGRRKSGAGAPVLRLADLELDTITRIAHRAGQTIELTAREFRLLEFLLRSQGRVCTRMMILEKVWDYGFDPGSNLVDVYVRKLREKIDAAFPVKLLHSVRGEGYILKESE